MKKWFFILSLCFFTNNSLADDSHVINEINIGIGQSKDHIGIYRLGLKKNFETTFFYSDHGWLSGYYEASLNYWKKNEDHIYGIALSPVFVYYFANKTDVILPYIEAGIGVAAISDTMIYGRNMSTTFQFEDRIGVGIKTTLFDLNARYMHYSNAGLKKPNNGIDIFMFTLAYRF